MCFRSNNFDNDCRFAGFRIFTSTAIMRYLCMNIELFQIYMFNITILLQRSQNFTKMKVNTEHLPICVVMASCYKLNVLLSFS